MPKGKRGNMPVACYPERFLRSKKVPRVLKLLLIKQILSAGMIKKEKLPHVKGTIGSSYGVEKSDIIKFFWSKKVGSL